MNLHSCSSAGNVGFIRYVAIFDDGNFHGISLPCSDKHGSKKSFCFYLDAPFPTQKIFVESIAFRSPVLIAIKWAFRMRLKMILVVVHCLHSRPSPCGMLSKFARNLPGLKLDLR